MAGAVKTIKFATRQAEIRSCDLVNLKVSAGNVPSEYIPGSELHNDDGTWSYQFLIQEEDLPGSTTLQDINECALVEPFWACAEADEEEEEAEECATRSITCFDALEVIETLAEGDMVAIVRHDEECDTYCLGMMNPYDFAEQTQNPVED